MTTIVALTGSHLRTYQTLFQHPVSHNLGWHDVHALFRQLGEVEEEPNGNLKVTRNGRTLILNPPRTKDVETTDEVMALRHFIEHSETLQPHAPAKDARWLVVIDHHEARIFRSSETGTVAQQIRPHTQDDFSRHSNTSKGIFRGQEKPDPNSYFEPVAGVLNGAGQILVFGTGTGTGNEMDQFIAWLKKHRPEVAGESSARRSSTSTTSPRPRSSRRHGHSTRRPERDDLRIPAPIDAALGQGEIFHEK